MSIRENQSWMWAESIHGLGGIFKVLDGLSLVGLGWAGLGWVELS